MASECGFNIEEEYRELFAMEDGTTADACAKRLKERGLTGDLKGIHLRSIVWKIFLEILPPYVPESEWPARITQARKSYEELCDKYTLDPHACESYDPLSQSEDNVWNQYFKNEELKKEITKDIDRTYPEHEFFQTETTHNNLTRILFIYAKEHPDASYRQGMHELLAPIYFVVYTEAQQAPAEGDDNPIKSALRILLDPKYIEHDSFALFSALMNNASEFFISSSITSNSAYLHSQIPQEEQLTPVVDRCRKIHHVLLKQKDPTLYAHLVKSKVEPQLYGLKWLRLLFGREFHLQDLLILWDAIFAFGRSLKLVDYICVAMLIYIREQLLQMDEMTVMKRLLKYPPVEDITVFVRKAVELATPTTKKVTVESLTASPAPSASAAAAKEEEEPKTAIVVSPGPQAASRDVHENREKVDHKPQPKQQGRFQSFFNSFLDTKPQQDPKLQAEVTKLREDIEKMKAQNEFMAGRLDKTIGVLQEEFSKNALLSENGTIIKAMAELKQLKAIFSGVLQESNATEFLK